MKLKVRPNQPQGIQSYLNKKYYKKSIFRYQKMYITRKQKKKKHLQYLNWLAEFLVNTNYSEPMIVKSCTWLINADANKIKKYYFKMPYRKSREHLIIRIGVKTYSSEFKFNVPYKKKPFHKYSDPYYIEYVSQDSPKCFKIIKKPPALMWNSHIEVR